MTHREMVILSPQRGITVTREQMEAHLALHGWEPFMVAQGAAIKDGLVVFAFDERLGGNVTGIVGVNYDTLAGLNLTGQAKWGVAGATKADERRTDSWIMSDKYFWPVAHRCTELDNQGLT